MWETSADTRPNTIIRSEQRMIVAHNKWYDRATRRMIVARAIGPPALDTKHVDRLLWTKAKGNQVIDNITADYKTPEVIASVQPAPSGPAQLILPDGLSLGSDFRAEVRLTNPTNAPLDFLVHRRLTAITNGNQIVGELGESLEVIVTVPAGGTISLPIQCSWGDIRPYYPGAEFISLQGAVRRQDTNEVWSLEGPMPAIVGILDIPVTVSSLVPQNIPVGTVFDATVTVTNPLPEVLNNVALIISGGRLTPIDGTREEERVAIGTLNPGQTVSVTRTFKAVDEGYATVVAWFAADGINTSGDGRDVRVNRCPGDMNQDTVVDSDDFLRFVIAYNLFDCDARKMDVRCLGDLNIDGVVDGQDFQLFVLAYNQLLCE